MGLTGMRMRAVLLLPMALALMAGAPPQAARTTQPGDAQPDPIAVVLPPGPAHEAALRVLLRPYAEATGTELAQPGWDGSAPALATLLATHTADLVLLGGVNLAALCKTGALQKLDWTPLSRDRFLPYAASDCGVGAYVSATLLAWDRDKLPATPNWGDFWDVAKHPGRRGLHHGARGNLEIALLADGVPTGDVYRTLRSADGVDIAHSANWIS